MRLVLYLKVVSNAMYKIPHLIKRNANNQRIAKEVNGTIVEKYLWLNQTTLLGFYDKEGNFGRFTYATDRIPISLEYKGQSYYLSYNHLGSLKSVRSSSGVIKQIDYDSFGNVLSETNPSDSSGSNPLTASIDIPLGFAGGLYDKDTKLIRFGYRDYDPYVGRWTAKDPIDFNGGDSNLYAYVGNDPVNGIDPEGKFWFQIIKVMAIGITIYGIYQFYEHSNNAYNRMGDSTINNSSSNRLQGLIEQETQRRKEFPNALGEVNEAEKV